jgi:hypothetical protein
MIQKIFDADQEKMLAKPVNNKFTILQQFCLFRACRMVLFLETL